MNAQDYEGQRIRIMMSVKVLAGYVLVGAAASVSVAPMAGAQTLPAAPSVMVNNSLQPVQTPMLGASGISYQQSSGQLSALTAFTEGFLFCTNVTTPALQQVKFMAAHEDQTLPTAHPWVFPIAYDVQNIAYAGGALIVNRGAAGAFLTTLTCHSTDVYGAVPSGMSDGIFDNQFESAAATNYSHQVNWNPPPGFDWNAADWTQVPEDGCDTASPHAVEDVACAAVTGYKPESTSGPIAPASRASVMWTAFDPSGLKFTYLFRIDGRAVPPLNSATIKLTDAFDGGSVGMVDGLLDPNGGQYCFLSQPPASLDSSACSASNGTVPLNGPLQATLTLAPIPLGSGVNQTYYVAVTRPVIGGHPSLVTPVVAVSVSVDPAIVAEGADKFSGDDVVFGFMPTSGGFVPHSSTPAGFEWMKRE